MSSIGASTSEYSMLSRQDPSSGEISEARALLAHLECLELGLEPEQCVEEAANAMESPRELAVQSVSEVSEKSPTETYLHSLTAIYGADFAGELIMLQALFDDEYINARIPGGSTPLHFAARGGHSDAVKGLLNRGSDLSWTDDAGHTASYEATRSNHCDVLQILADRGDDLRRVDKHGDSLLHAAARGGAREAFEMLINLGANTLRWRNNRGWTPIHFAVAESSVEIVKHIIDLTAGRQFQDASPDMDSLTFDHDGGTALTIAGSSGSREIVELLLDYGANIQGTDLSGRNALCRAILRGSTNITRALILRGADANARHQGDFFYPVLDAIFASNIEILEALIEGGAKISNATVDDGCTALHLAVKRGNYGLLRLLLNKKLSLDINARNHESHTPLNFAIYAGRIDAVHLLLKHGADALAEDSRGLTPLQWAVIKNGPRIVKLLMKHCADSTLASLYGGTALLTARMHLRGKDLEDMEKTILCSIEEASKRDSSHIALNHLLSAAESGDLNRITAILNKGNVSINLADEDAYTSLLMASENGENDAAEFLIRMGAEVNAKNAAGESCIWLACRYGHEAIVGMLLENGASVDSADETQQTTISVAAQGGHLSVVEVLLRSGADVWKKSITGKAAREFAFEGGHNVVLLALLVSEFKCLTLLTHGQRDILFALRQEDGIEHIKELCRSNGGRATRDLRTLYFESCRLGESAAPDAGSARKTNRDSISDSQTHGKDMGQSSSQQESLVDAPFVQLAEFGFNAGIDRLIRAGHALDKKDYRGYVALGMGAVHGHLSCVRTLLYHGSDPDIQDSEGRTALFWAAHGGRIDVARALIDAGANINITSNDLWSPLMVSASAGHFKVVKLLVEAGATKDLIDRRGLSALGFAVSGSHAEVVSYLLENGVDQGLKPDMTALSLAVDRGDAEMVGLLLQPGATIPPSTGDMSHLCIAARRGYEDVVKVLLQHGAKISDVTEEGWTALFYAASAGHEMVAQILIEVEGPSIVNYRDVNGLTAQSVAKLNGHESVARLLRNPSRLGTGTAVASAAAETSYFTYSSLSKPSCIRLLDLHPGLEHERISFDLNEVNMDLEYSYEALSYEWKGKTGSFAVQCNGMSLLITPNLKLALENIRLQDKPRTLWVDAVCINQGDFEERSYQVRMMTTIYKRASKVLMWLGEDSPEVKTAISSIPVVLRTWDGLSRHDVFHYLLASKIDTIQEGKELTKSVFAAVSGGKFQNSETDHGATELLRRPYFTRAWIYQELVLAGERGIVLCGENQVSWLDFLQFMAIWMLWKQNNYPRECDIFIAIIESCREVDGTGSVYLQLALGAMGLVNCGKPEDKVYAMMGTVDPSESWSDQLVPDYTLPVEQVYTNAARAIIQTTKTLGFWLDMNHPAANKISNLPSWVPDWTCVSSRYLDLDDGSTLIPLFECPRDMPSPSLVESHFRTDDTTLHADGYFIGEIAFSVTMSSGEDIYHTIIRPLVQALKLLGLGIFEPCMERNSYLSVFFRLLESRAKYLRVDSKLTQSHMAYLAWKIIDDPNTPETVREVPPELGPAVQDYARRSSMDADQFNHLAHGVCLEMELALRHCIGSFAQHYSGSSDQNAPISCDLYCTRSGHLGIAGAQTIEDGFHLVLLEGYRSIAMLRRKQSGAGGEWHEFVDGAGDEWYEFVNGADDEWYEFVDGAIILELDWRSYRTLEDIPIDGKMKSLKIR